MVGHVERMDGSRFAKRVDSNECVGNRSTGRPKQRWIESVNQWLIKRNVIWLMREEW